MNGLFVRAIRGDTPLVRITSGAWAGLVGTLTVYDTAKNGTRLFVVTAADGGQAFLYPESYQIERVEA